MSNVEVIELCVSVFIATSLFWIGFYSFVAEQKAKTERNKVRKILRGY